MKIKYLFVAFIFSVLYLKAASKTEPLMVTNNPDMNVFELNDNTVLDPQNGINSSLKHATDSLKIVFMGSSVCNGSGAINMHGYRYLYSELLKDRKNAGGIDWTTSNISIGGESTVDVMRRWQSDLIPQYGRYVVYGLSLGNEGIVGGGQKIFNQFRDNLQKLIVMARTNGIEPVIVNCYSRNNYTKTEYDFVKNINSLIQGWDVASINSLGAIDDGTGHWADGYWFDRDHPNDAGHLEICYAIVPSLFDALKVGKPQPHRVTGDYIKFHNKKNIKQLVFVPESTIHPFTVSFDIKTNGNGTIASFKQGKAFGVLKTDAATGVIIYESPFGGQIKGTVAVNDGKWHKITLTHSYAKGKTDLYCDAKKAGILNEKLLATAFYLNDKNSPSAISYKDWLFYRSGMNSQEIDSLNSGKMLKSSLELYAPLDGQKILSSNPYINLAQSTNEITIIKIDKKTNKQ